MSKDNEVSAFVLMAMFDVEDVVLGLYSTREAAASAGSVGEKTLMQWVERNTIYGLPEKKDLVRLQIAEVSGSRVIDITPIDPDAPESQQDNRK